MLQPYKRSESSVQSLVLGSLSLVLEKAGDAGGAVAQRLHRPFARRPQHHTSHPETVTAGQLAGLRKLEAGSLQQAVDHDRHGRRVLRRPKLRQLGRGLHSRISLKPKGPGSNDRSLSERIVNVATCLPFIVVGFHTMRRRQTPEGRQFGACLMTVGVTASMYHSNAGRVRTFLRKLDYWTISLATASMVRALLPDAPKAAKVAGLASLSLVPFQPLLVSSAHIAVMEAEFARTALKDPTIRSAYARHAAAAAIGGSCFLLEDRAIDMGIHWVHALWHLLACHGVSSTNLLMERHERQ